MTVDTLDRYVDLQLANMLPEYWLICRSTYRPILDRHVARHIGRYIDRHSADTSADMLRLTVGGVSVDCRWYRSIVNSCLAEIAAISLPTREQQSTHKKYAQDYRIQRKSCIEKV